MSEAISYLAAWQRGDSWPLPPSPVTMSYAIRAAYLWQNGGTYSRQSGTAEPMCWVATHASSVARTTATKFFSAAIRAISRSQVTITVTPPSGTSAWGVEESLPAGLTPSSVTGPNANWNVTTRKISWYGTGASAAVLGYTLSGTAGTYTLGGAASMDGTDSAVGGSVQVTLVDAIVQNDFDGDGRSDLGYYLPSGGQWMLQYSGGGTQANAFGYVGTIPITGDFDGDGVVDYGCYDAVGLFANGRWLAQPGSWYIMQSRDGFRTATFGYGGTVPIVGDFDGDGVADFGCYDASGLYANGRWLAQPGSWYIMQSRDGFRTATFGYGGTVPVVGDFDGDGVTDFGCYDASGLYANGRWLAQPGSWYIMQSRSGFRTATFGYGGTVPVVGDYDADGISDFGCYDANGIPGNVDPGTWFIMRSSDGFTRTVWGAGGSIPLGK